MAARVHESANTDPDADQPLTMPNAQQQTDASPAKHPGLQRSLSTSRFGSAFDASNFYLADDQFSGLTLLDLFVLVEAHCDRWATKIKTTSREWRNKAEEASGRIKTKAEDLLAKRNLSFRDLTAGEFGISGNGSSNGNEMRSRKAPRGRKETPAEIIERELKQMKQRMSSRMEKLQTRWQDSKMVSTREKVAFVLGVMNVLVSALLLGFRPEWIPWSYSIQLTFLLPIRVYTYRKKLYHYFLLDSCYLFNIMFMLYLWVFPQSVYLLEACYALSHGPLASAVATWRNSLVFHSLDKVTSLFIHIYPAFVFMTIVHHYPDRMQRFPALEKMQPLNVLETVLVSSTIYLVWQIAYYWFVIVARKEKIEKGGRITSFTYLLNDKKGMIGKILAHIRPQWREPSFMFCQYLYTVVTMMPALIFMWSSTYWNGVYLVLIFAVSVWNGSVFYLEVWTRRFEKEIIKLRQELEAVQQEAAVARTANSSSTTSPYFGPSVHDSPTVSPNYQQPRSASDGQIIPPLNLNDSDSGVLVEHEDAAEQKKGE